MSSKRCIKKTYGINKVVLFAEMIVLLLYLCVVTSDMYFITQAQNSNQMTTSVFGQIFQEHIPNLQAFALQLTRDKNDAEDLYQDTLYKAIRYRHLYKPKTNLQAWLMTIMRNTFINEWRRRKRKQQIAEMQIPGVTFSQTTPVQNGGERKMVMQEIMKALNELDKGLSKPFLMAFKGFKYEEIAQEMDLPLGTVKSRIHQARKLLKAKIRRNYQEDSLQDILAN